MSTTTDAPVEVQNVGTASSTDVELTRIGVSCAGCQNTFMVNAELSWCPWCGGRTLRPTPEANVVVAERTLPAGFGKGEAVAKLRASLEALPKRHRPASLLDETLAQQLRLVWLPQWLVDFDMHATWDCEAGFEYAVETHREKKAEGGAWSVETEKRIQADWARRVGQVSRRFENIAAPAVNLSDVFDFAARSDRPFAVSDVSGGQALMLPALNPSAAWLRAEERMPEILAAVLKKACGAERLRNMSFEERYSAHHWTVRLRPVYTTSYVTSQGEVEVVRVHGERGTVHGRWVPDPDKVKKPYIAAAVACALLVILVGIAKPELLVVGTLQMGFLIILAGLGAAGSFKSANRPTNAQTGEKIRDAQKKPSLLRTFTGS